MERLLEDAEELTGIKYDISNLNDVYSAIHAIQVETKVAGTTSKEAANTISGSVQMAKASWQNLLIALGTGEGLDAAVDNFLKALGTAAKNIIPRVITIAGSVVKGLVKAIPQLMQSLATAIGNFANKLNSAQGGKFVNAGLKLIGSLIKGILKALPQILSALGQLAKAMINQLKSIDLRAVGRAIIDGLLSGLQAAWNALSNWVSGRVSWIKNMFSSAKAAGNAPAGAGGRGHRIGIREVPYDNYSALLHKGETILTAAETNRYKEMLNSGGDTYNGGDITVNVYGSDGMSVSQLASAVEQKLIQMQKRRTLAWQ